MDGNATYKGVDEDVSLSPHCDTTAILASRSPMRRVFYEVPLLSSSLECIHPRLREDVEVKDRMALLHAARLLEEHGSPEDVVRRLASGQEDQKKGQKEQLETMNLQDDTENVSMPFTCEPAFSSPRTVHSSQHDADDELMRRCHFFLWFLKDGDECFNIPYDVQRRVVPLLYEWIVDWDFFRRNTMCWKRVAHCFSSVILFGRRRLRSVRPDFSLPWKPLVVFIMSLFFQSTNVMEHHVLHGMQKAAGEVLESICESAALHFDEDALSGLWETFAPYFSPGSEESPLMLCLFSHLIPVHRLVDDTTGVSLPLTERIVQFLLSDSLYWQQQSGNWLAYSLKIIFKMALHRVGVADFDKYAEPLFSMMLFELRLPITNGVRRPRGNVGFGVLSEIPFFRVDKYELSLAHGFIGNMLPRRTDSPLWNHLRRFILATNVFLRSNATDSDVLRYVFQLYSSLVAAVHRRMDIQAKYQYTQATRPDRLKGRQPILPAYLWDTNAVKCFVDLMVPVILSSLHHRLNDAPRIVGLLVSLSPTSVQLKILPYIDAGLRSRLESPEQRILAVRLLTKSLFPLSECRETRDDCWIFLADVVPVLLPWINPSEITLSSCVLELIFATCSVTRLRNLLGGQSAECEFAVALIERIFECSNHIEPSKGSLLERLIHVTTSLSCNVSDETLACCVRKALKEAEVQGTASKACVVSCLLEPLAKSAPERVMRWATRSLMPPLQSASTQESEVSWCAWLLAGCVRGAGLACFSYRHQLLRCIRWQLSYVTKPQRVMAATRIYSALYTAFTETVCTKAEARPFFFETPNRLDTKAAEELEAERMDDAYKVEMGLCRSSSVEITWREASEEHLSFVVNVYQSLLQDIVDLIHGIEHVSPPISVDGSGGLRHLIPSSSSSGGDARNGTNNDNNEDTDGGKNHSATGKYYDAKDGGDDDKDKEKVISEIADENDSFSPQNVLRGTLQWLRNVLEINQELHMQLPSLGSPNMMSWWTQDPKTAWKLPLKFPPSSLSLFPWARQDAIHDLLLKEVYGRLVGNAVGGRGVVSAVLQLGHEHGMEGKPTLDNGHAADTDVRSLHSVLAILAGQCNITLMSRVSYDEYHMYDRGPGCFGWCVVEVMRRRRYFPTLYWSMKAEAFIRARRRRFMPVVSPRCLSELVSVAHTLLFSPHHLIQSDCSHILMSCMYMMGQESSHRFITRHLSILGRIAEMWKKQSSTSNYRKEKKETQLTECKSFSSGSGPAPMDNDCCDDCSNDKGKGAEPSTILVAMNDIGEGDRNIRNDGVTLEHDISEEKKNAMYNRLQLPRELCFALYLAPTGFGSLYFYRDSDLVRRTYELVLQFPEELTAQWLGAHVSMKKITQLSGLLTMDHMHAVGLSDELLSLAARFSTSAPDRAVRALRMIIAVYRPSRMALLSPQSVPILFRLTLNTHAMLREISLHILQTLLLSLKNPHKKAYVLVRRGSLEDSENLGFFHQRHEVLKQKCPSFYGMHDIGFVFLPKVVCVDAVHVSSDMFNDGEAVNVPAETLLLRKAYTEGVDESEELPTEQHKSVHMKQQARGKLIELIGFFSGILDEELNPSTIVQQKQGAKKEEGDALERRLRKGWMWNVMQTRHDQKTFSQSRMRVWKALGKLLGVEPAVTMFTRIVRLRIRDYINLTRSNSDESRESPQWLFSCLSDLMVAAIRISKRHPAARQMAISCYLDTVMQVCTSNLIPHEVLDSIVETVSALYGTLKPDEVWSIYEPLFAALTSPAEEMAVLTTQNLPMGDGDVDAAAAGSTSWYSGRSQETVRVLLVIAQFICVFAREVNVLLLPNICQQVMTNKRVFFFSTITRIRQCAATVIQQIMRLCLHQSEYIPANSNVLENIITFLDQAERLVELPSPDLLPTLVPWSATPALGAVPNPFMATNTTAITITNTTATAATDDFALSLTLPPASSPSWSDAFSLDGSHSTTTSNGLLALKTFTLCWYGAPAPLLDVRAREAIILLVRSLDANTQEMDDLSRTVQATLDSIAYVRLSKNTVHNILELLCDILQEKKPYGRSRQAKVTLIHMLKIVLFINLHRIGKFEVMRNVSHAALNSIAHGDGHVRTEGKFLLAVLTKVASIEQTQALVKGFFDELRESSSSSSSSSLVTATAAQSMGVCSSPHSTSVLQERLRNRQRNALVLALCYILSANLGAIPPYVPRLMERLAACWNGPSLEVQRAVKRAFEDWWRSHCNTWELEHMSHFSAAQIEVILPLLKAPMYLV